MTYSLPNRKPLKRNIYSFIVIMGRIKSTFVKTSATKIYEKGSEEFTDNFDKNKEVVAKYAEIPSKRLRNSIVGFITRIVKKQQVEE